MGITSKFLFILLLCLSFVAHAELVPLPPALKAKAYVLVDYDSGQILAEKRAEIRDDPGEFTKVMTAYVVAQEIENGKLDLSDTAKISAHAWSKKGKQSFLKKGSRITVQDLLMGLAVQSGDDAAVALAERVAGSETGFVALMNQAAQRLGLKDTHFDNASGEYKKGASSTHYSTPRDLAKLANALIRNFPVYYKMYSLKHFSYNKVRQYSRNNLLKTNDAVDGLAVSHGSSEGYALMLSAKKEKMRVTSVLFGGQSANARDQESEKLVNYGFRFFETHRVYSAFEPVAQIRVWKGDTSELPVGLTQDLYITIPKGQYQKLDARMQVGADLVAPVQRGQKLGYVTISLGKKSYARKPLVSLMDVHDGNFWHNLLDAILMPFN